MPAKVGSSEIFIKYGKFYLDESFSVYKPAYFKAFFLFSYISNFLLRYYSNCFYKSYMALLFFCNYSIIILILACNYAILA